jgi:hypothetical protein
MSFSFFATGLEISKIAGKPTHEVGDEDVKTITTSYSSSSPYQHQLPGLFS